MTTKKTITKKDLKKIITRIEKKYKHLDDTTPHTYDVNVTEFKIYADNTQASIELKVKHFATSTVRSVLHELNHLELFDVSVYHSKEYAHVGLTLTIK